MCKSDSRGLFDVPEASGEPVYAGPRDVKLHVRIAASNASAAELTQVVRLAERCSPVAALVQSGMPLGLDIEVLAS